MNVSMSLYERCDRSMSGHSGSFFEDKLNKTSIRRSLSIHTQKSFGFRKRQLKELLDITVLLLQKNLFCKKKFTIQVTKLIKILTERGKKKRERCLTEEEETKKTKMRARARRRAAARKRAAASQKRMTAAKMRARVDQITILMLPQESQRATLNPRSKRHHLPAQRTHSLYLPQIPRALTLRLPYSG